MHGGPDTIFWYTILCYAIQGVSYFVDRLLLYCAQYFGALMDNVYNSMHNILVYNAFIQNTLLKNAQNFDVMYIYVFMLSWKYGHRTI